MYTWYFARYVLLLAKLSNFYKMYKIILMCFMFKNILDIGHNNKKNILDTQTTAWLDSTDNIIFFNFIIIFHNYYRIYTWKLCIFFCTKKIRVYLQQTNY